MPPSGNIIRNILLVSSLRVVSLTKHPVLPHSSVVAEVIASKYNISTYILNLSMLDVRLVVIVPCWMPTIKGQKVVKHGGRKGSILVN